MNTKENDMAQANLAAVPETEPTPVPEATPEKESTVKQRLLGQAMIQLRERHRDEYDEIAREAFRAVGLTYSRRLSERERTLAKIQTLARQAGVSVTIEQPEAATE